MKFTALLKDSGFSKVSEFWLVRTLEQKKDSKRGTKRDFSKSKYANEIVGFNIITVPMAETLEEFDQPSPCTVGFCQQIPLEEYDQRSAQTTQAALHGLIDHLDSNPQEFYKILRRKKADNLKLLQFVKVKVMNKLQDDYLEKYFPEEQCQRELESLKREMASAYDYAQGLSSDNHEKSIRIDSTLYKKK